MRSCAEVTLARYMHNRIRDRTSVSAKTWNFDKSNFQVLLVPNNLCSEYWWLVLDRNVRIFHFLISRTSSANRDSAYLPCRSPFFPCRWSCAHKYTSMYFFCQIQKLGSATPHPPPHPHRQLSLLPSPHLIWITLYLSTLPSPQPDQLPSSEHAVSSIKKPPRCSTVEIASKSRLLRPCLSGSKRLVRKILNI